MNMGERALRTTSWWVLQCLQHWVHFAHPPHPRQNRLMGPVISEHSVISGMLGWGLPVPRMDPGIPPTFTGSPIRNGSTHASQIPTTRHIH